jgi:HlyD family secretion protein
MKRTAWIFIVILGAVAALAIGVRTSTRDEAVPEIATTAVSRGSIVEAIAATGTLEAVTTVEVGSQVSGTIQELKADFNSIVRKGQVLARLDPSLFETALEQARANLAKSEADVERLNVALTDADRQLQRARELSARQLIPQADLDTAEVNRRSAEAQVKSAEAQVTQARSAVQTAQVNLEKTVISSPIDGIVIARNVNAGQTVAASLQAPTLFVIAADLTRMQVNASIDESDLGHIATGQRVQFRVDAYPNESFTGTVSQVRLDPTVTSNVVTYAAMIDAPNPELKLKPGMTANLTIEVARADDALWVPNTALRLRPTADALKAVGAAQPDVAATTGSGSTGMVWVRNAGVVQPVTVTLGVSDGTRTQIVDAPFGEGAEVLTKLAFPASGTTTTGARPATSSNPLMPTPPRGPAGPPPGR